MRLHGPIQVDDKEVGYWTAEQIDLTDTYRCTVDWTPDGFTRYSNGQRYPYTDQHGHIHHAMRHTFTLAHDHLDSNITLAAKVLAACIDNQPKPTP